MLSRFVFKPSFMYADLSKRARITHTMSTLDEIKSKLDGFSRCVRILRSQTEDKGRTTKVDQKILVDAERNC